MTLTSKAYCYIEATTSTTSACCSSSVVHCHAPTTSLTN